MSKSKDDRHLIVVAGPDGSAKSLLLQKPLKIKT